MDSKQIIMMIKISADRIIINHNNLKKICVRLKKDSAQIIMMIKISPDRIITDRIIINHNNLKKSACYHLIFADAIS